MGEDSISERIAYYELVSNFLGSFYPSPRGGGGGGSSKGMRIFRGAGLPVSGYP